MKVRVYCLVGRLARTDAVFVVHRRRAVLVAKHSLAEERSARARISTALRR